MSAPLLRRNHLAEQVRLVLRCIDFLRECDQIEEGDAGCLFTTREVQQDTYIRVVQTDRPEILGRLLSFLSLRNFPPAAQTGERATSLGR